MVHPPGKHEAFRKRVRSVHARLADFCDADDGSLEVVIGTFERRI
jgi:hypothetical protein